VKCLLITGASGYLGARLVTAAAQAGWATTGTFHTRPFTLPNGRAAPLDLRQPRRVAALLADLQPEAIIHAACSNRDAEAIAAIVPAARHLAQAAADHGLRLVHVSTDLVFGGQAAPYDDFARPAPLGDYGRAKAEAEAVVAELCPSAAIARPSLIWALEPLDRTNRWLVDAARCGERVTLFTDEIRCPVHLHDLAGALLELAGRPDIVGPLNLVGPQPLNRWDFGLRLLAALGLPRGSNVLPGTVAESGLERAKDLTLHAQRARNLLTTRLRSVDDALHQHSAAARRPRYCEG
jgi:dTDP-4-dehydrorhamnose reductase